MIGAAIGDHYDVMELLLAKGADVSAMDSSGSTALHYAAQKGRLSLVELLVSKGADIEQTWQEPWNGVCSTGPWTSLHIAAVHGHTSVVQLLLSKGAAVRVVDTDGNTPADFAARHGFLEISALLGSCNPKPAASTTHSMLPCNVNDDRGHTDVLVEQPCQGTSVAPNPVGVVVEGAKKNLPPPAEVVRHQLDEELSRWSCSDASGPSGAVTSPLPEQRRDTQGGGCAIFACVCGVQGNAESVLSAGWVGCIVGIERHRYGVELLSPIMIGHRNVARQTNRLICHLAPFATLR